MKVVYTHFFRIRYVIGQGIPQKLLGYSFQGESLGARFRSKAGFHVRAEVKANSHCESLMPRLNVFDPKYQSLVANQIALPASHSFPFA